MNSVTKYELKSKISTQKLINNYSLVTATVGFTKKKKAVEMDHFNQKCHKYFFLQKQKLCKLLIFTLHL